MATSTVACNVCSVSQITTSAAFWCFECDARLCTDCRKKHKQAKATREDYIITIEEYQELPPFIIGIKLRCDEHCEKYQTYCKNHENLCCRKCATTSHKNCQDKVPLKEVVNNVKNSSSFQEMEHLLDVLTRNIRIIIASGENNLKMLNETKEDIAKEFKQTRIAINGYLDKLEKELLTELQKESVSAKCMIKESEATLAKTEKEFLECQDNFQNIKTHASDLQAFVGLKQIEAKKIKNERIVQSLIDDEKVYQRMLNCKIDPKLTTLTTDVKSFGKVTTRITPCDITVVRNPIGQCGKCNSGTCITCKMIQCTHKFKSTFTKEEFIIKCTATCKTNNIIYLMECAICGLQYIGQTRRKLKERMYEHRSNTDGKPASSLHKHLGSTNHDTNFDEMKVTIIEHDPNWNDKRRQEREHFWIIKLKTLSPNGINEKM